MLSNLAAWKNTKQSVKLKLKINEEKTKDLNLNKGDRFGFVEFDYRKIKTRTGKWGVLYQPKKQAKTEAQGQGNGNLQVQRIATTEQDQGCNKPDFKGMDKLLQGTQLIVILYEYNRF